MKDFQAVLYVELDGDYIAVDYKQLDTDALAEQYIVSKLGTVSDTMTIVLGKLYRQGFEGGELAWVHTGDEYEF